MPPARAEEGPAQYVDSLGNELPMMAYSHALRTALGLARLAAGTSADKTACATVGEAATRASGTVDGLCPTYQASDHVPLGQPDEGFDPTRMSEALRHVIWLASRMAASPTTFGGAINAPDWHEEYQALDVARDLLALHGDALDQAVPAALGRAPHPPITAAELRVRALLETWHREAAHLPNVDAMTGHPAYAALLREAGCTAWTVLRRMRNGEARMAWFRLLRDATGANPVHPDHAGRLRQMATDWLRWDTSRRTEGKRP